MKLTKYYAVPDGYVRFGKKHGYKISIYYSSWDSGYYFKLEKLGRIFISKLDNQLIFKTEADCIEACEYCIETNMMFDRG